MTDSNPFFRFVWRANALLILFAALGTALVLGAFAAFNLAPLLREFTDGPDFHPAPKQGEQKDPAAEPAGGVRIGSFQASGDVYYAPLYRTLDRDEAKPASFSKSSGYDARALNLVFFDPAKDEVRRLLPDERGLITQQTTLRDGNDLSGRVRALLLTYIPADTDGDGRLDDGDAKRIILVRPDGSAMATLADGVDALDTTWRVDGAATLRYFTRVGEEVSFGEVDLDSFAVPAEKKVPLPKP
ncbi:hypothetical protein [Methylopila sp. M107]|uniref:hypothetical protein n=1 Tax=Methylopila sp. M107 TaxID=1101190 RepID=UPI00036613B1|nr:hypothetical protein [Methylopila sp. M107]